MWYAIEHQHYLRTEYIGTIRKLFRDLRKAPAAVFIFLLAGLWALAWQIPRSDVCKAREHPLYIT